MLRSPDPAGRDTGGSILLISDNADLSLLIESAFRSHGFLFAWETQPERGLRDSLDGGHRLVLVDASTRGVEVLELVRRFGARSLVPVIVISPLSHRADLVAMLENGADDYLAGPIDPDEVVARARAVLRRLDAHRGRPGELVDIGRIRITPASRQVRVDGVLVDLTPLEYDILDYLARAMGRAVSRDEVMRAVRRRGAAPLNRSLDVHISHLRRKLQPQGSRILTIRGIGYMMAAADAESADAVT
ncbi:MAG TPA: response regulator transcription factor [Vicinamibacterales bacterium]|nr:response regulator transcription factor [Vicinamibacterales bacterium]